MWGEAGAAALALSCLPGGDAEQEDPLLSLVDSVVVEQAALCTDRRHENLVAGHSHEMETLSVFKPRAEEPGLPSPLIAVTLRGWW